MLYKEWLLARTKLKILGVIYFIGIFYVGTIGVITLAVFGSVPLGSNSDKFRGLFTYWGGVGALIAFISAILASADAFSEETEKNTLSFLMSRPISRVTIYSNKLLAGLAITLIPYLVCGLLASWFDLIFTTGPETYFENLSSMLLITSIVSLVVGMGTLISLFTRYTLLALILTMVIAVIIVIVSNGISSSFNNFKLFTEGMINRTIVTLGMGMISYLLYLLGKTIISHRQF